MTDTIVQDLELREREKLYSQLSEASKTLKSTEDKDSHSSVEQSSIDDDKINEATGAEDLSIDGYRKENYLEKHHEEEQRNRPTNLLTDFQQLSLFQRLWYHVLSLFTRKPAETLFRKSQLDEVRYDINQQNNELIYFDRGSKLYLVSAYLPERFNTIFKLSLEVLPIINEVDQNLKFMQDIITKLLFNTYRNNSGKQIRIDAENFITEEEFRDFVFMGDVVTKSKIDNLMQEVTKESKILPLSLYKYSANILKALYQFQKICYFPYSNFFQTFRTDKSNDNNIYTNVLSQEAYDSISILYLLIQEVGFINFDKNCFREIISSYFNMVKQRKSHNGVNSNKTAIHFLESFSRLQTMWNTFVQKIPIKSLLLFVTENPYFELPPKPDIDNEILENLPMQIERAYQQSVLKNIEKMAQSLREKRTKYFFSKYLSQTPFTRSAHYSNRRKDLMPIDNEQSEGPFAHCESFAYTQHFLHCFCADNMIKPLHVLSKSVFKSDNYIYNKIVDFLGELENHKVKLDIIEQGLQPEHRVDLEIKEILLRMEQRSEEAKEEYTTILMNIDRQVRYQIEQVIKELQKFSMHGITAIANSILDEVYYQKFNSFIPQFQYMQDYNNPKYAPLTPSGILELWKQYISESCLLILDQLEQERQSLLGQVSKVAASRSRRSQ